MQGLEMNLQDLLTAMWVDYCDLNPAARRIFDLLTGAGEEVLNDHIALRSLNHPRLGIQALARSFKKFGYVEKGEYFFQEKCLYAQHFEHPDLNLPKIFISELQLEKISPFARKTLSELVEKIPQSLLDSDQFSMCGRPWDIDYSTYLKLADESEYAGWVSAFGFRPNHFTVNVNHFKKITDLQQLNQFIESHGYELNQSGGKIKGTPAQLLEQSSTRAKPVSVNFAGTSQMIPGCYYEFAKRYSLPNGKLYQGFIASSADKIFESTDRDRNMK